MRGLYPIVDVDSLRQLGNSGLGLVDFAASVLAASPSILQLRAKHSGARDTLELLRALRPLCTRAGTRLFANDRPDLAVLAKCDGVHVGQDDLPLPLVRQIAPGLLVGVSTHSPAQLQAALAERPDYVAFGPVFSTVSKERPDPSVGIDGLSEAHSLARTAGIPLVAIGGITLERAREIAARCELGAVIAELTRSARSARELAATARALHAALGGASRAQI